MMTLRDLKLIVDRAIDAGLDLDDYVKVLKITERRVKLDNDEEGVLRTREQWAGLDSAIIDKRLLLLPVRGEK